MQLASGMQRSSQEAHSISEPMRFYFLSGFLSAEVLLGPRERSHS